MSKKKFKLSKKEVLVIRSALELASIAYQASSPETEEATQQLKAHLLKVARKHFGSTMANPPKPKSEPSTFCSVEPKPMKIPDVPIEMWASLSPKVFTARVAKLSDYGRLNLTTATQDFLHGLEINISVPGTIILPGVKGRMTRLRAMLAELEPKKPPQAKATRAPSKLNGANHPCMPEHHS